VSSLSKNRNGVAVSKKRIGGPNGSPGEQGKVKTLLT